MLPLIQRWLRDTKFKIIVRLVKIQKVLVFRVKLADLIPVDANILVPLEFEELSI